MTITETRSFGGREFSKTSAGRWVRTAPGPITLEQADALAAINRKFDGFDGFELAALEQTERTLR